MNGGVPLSQEEIRRRIAALRELRGMTQSDMNAAFESLGGNKTDAGRAERGNIDLTDTHLWLYTQVLRVPPEWFTEEDVEVLLGNKPRGPISPEEAAALAARLLAGFGRGGVPGQ
jgi:transcriptional regulator with XRE-family HTH domain